ncbi:amidohydrolase family protein [Brevibacterium litoralis]|uniref:amidohydrolase family protein n=1 Tax=Brevibacterium litoralis TaxID=3138935 RepID=UPI0032EAC506
MRDEDVPAYTAALGLPGLADIHVHFLPPPMERKVWAYFDEAGRHYGKEWPIRYRFPEDERLQILRDLGLHAIPALTYPHKPGMAQWLNDWNAEFAARVPDGIHCGTLYPEEGVGDYVEAALESGARLFKMHVQVGEFAPDDPLLDPAWAALQEAGVPVVIHAGSSPLPGAYTGPDHVRTVLERFPRLTLVIAHMGNPEYREFTDLTEEYVNVHLDTTMVGTDFWNDRNGALPDHHLARLGGMPEKVVLGTDFPNIPYDYAHQIEALEAWGLGDDWMRAVLWDNGARLLGLAPRE